MCSIGFPNGCLGGEGGAVVCLIACCFPDICEGFIPDDHRRGEGAPTRAAGSWTLVVPVSNDPDLILLNRIHNISENMAQMTETRRWSSEKLALTKRQRVKIEHRSH